MGFSIRSKGCTCVGLRNISGISWDSSSVPRYLRFITGFVPGSSEVTCSRQLWLCISCLAPTSSLIRTGIPAIPTTVCGFVRCRVSLASPQTDGHGGAGTGTEPACMLPGAGFHRCLPVVSSAKRLRASRNESATHSALVGSQLSMARYGTLKMSATLSAHDFPGSVLQRGTWLVHGTHLESAGNQGSAPALTLWWMKRTRFGDSQYLVEGVADGDAMHATITAADGESGYGCGSPLYWRSQPRCAESSPMISVENTHSSRLPPSECSKSSCCAAVQSAHPGMHPRRWMMANCVPGGNQMSTIRGSLRKSLRKKN